MLHFTCDLCGQQLGDQRFVVRLEVYPAFDPEELDEADLDVDHLQAVSEMIHEMESTGSQSDEDDCGPKEFRFDLCPDCQQRYARDPLGRDAMRRLNFSEN
jgi:hypothetical protein